MRRKHGARSHMKDTSSSATAPAFQSPGLPMGSTGGEELTKVLVSLGPTGDRLVPPKSESDDTGYGEVLRKRARSPSPTVLDHVAAPSGTIHKRQKSEAKDLDENVGHELPAVLSPHAETQGGRGASYGVNGGPVHVRQDRSAEPNVGYRPNNTPSDQDAPGHGASVTDTSTTAAPLAKILNDENTGSGIVGTTSTRDGITPVGVGHDRNPGQSGFGYPNIVSNQAYYPSQAAHGVCLAAAAHNSDNDLQPPPVVSAVGNGPVVDDPVATHSPGIVPSINPAFTASDNETQQPSVQIDQGTSTGPIQNPQPRYENFATTNDSAVPDTPVAGQGLGGVPPVSHGQAEQTTEHIDDDYGGIEYPLSPAWNLTSTMPSGVSSPVSIQGFQQPDGIPSASASNVSSVLDPTANPGSHQPAVMPLFYHATAAGPVNQGPHQHREIQSNTAGALMLKSQAQHPPALTGSSDPDIVAQAVIVGEHPAHSGWKEHDIRPGQFQLVIAAVANSLRIPLPGLGQLEAVHPGVPADFMSVSLSTQAPLDGASEPFGAFETAFLRAIIPPAVVASMCNTPGPPHEALAVTGNRDFSGAD